MEHLAILNDLKNKNYKPIYLLQGEENYYGDIISNYIEKNVLTDAEKGFNQTIFYGKDSNPITIIESARRFPMMAEKQVIIIKEAQSLSKIELLENYANHPLDSTILVINYKYKKIDARSKLYKAIKKHGVVLTQNKIRDYELPAWINSYLKAKNFEITHQASEILAAYLGADLQKVANELEKLIVALEEKTTITPDHIEKNIGISKDFNIYELQSALGERDVLKANRIINYFNENPRNNPIQKTIFSLYFYFSKLFKCHFLKDKSANGLKALGLHPYVAQMYLKASKQYTPAKLYQIIGILRDYDLKSKGLMNSSNSPEELQKEMIYKILH